jgi:hypothetical protein
MRLGLGSTGLGLLSIAAPTVLRSAGVHAAADTCHRMLGPAAPGGAATGWVSAAAAIVMVAVTRRTRRQAVRAQRATRIESWLGQHHQRDGAVLVVLPTAKILAYAAPGDPPQVVVSEGLTDALSDHELDAVIRHELAHLRHHHDRYLVTAVVVETVLGWMPPLRRSAGTLRLSVERWADEEAAQPPGTRSAVRSALLSTTTAMLAPQLAFTAVATLLARLDALGTAAPDPTWRLRVKAITPPIGLATAMAASAIAWSASSHSILGLLHTCPI